MQREGNGEAREVEALARRIVERATLMPAYLADDEQWVAALEEAKATYVEPGPLSPLRDAVRRASGRLNGEEVVQAIQAYNRGVLAAVDSPDISKAKDTP